MPTYRSILALLACVLAVGFFSSEVMASHSASASQQRQAIVLKQSIQFYRQATWRWQDMSLRSRTRAAYHERWTTGLPYLRWIKRLWVKRAAAAKRYAQNPPHKQQFLCIHSGIKDGRWSDSLEYLGGGYRVGQGEAPWTNPGVDWRGNPSPFYGGLAMDRQFQRSYATNRLLQKGTANRWTAYEQMWVAERAYYSGRGFFPWPTTARACGYI